MQSSMMVDRFIYVRKLRLTTRVTGRQRYALNAVAAAFDAPVHANSRAFPSILFEYPVLCLRRLYSNLLAETISFCQESAAAEPAN